MKRIFILCFCLLLSSNLHAMSTQERAQAAVGFLVFSVGVSGFVTSMIYGLYKDIECNPSTDQSLCCNFTNENTNFTEWLGFCNATENLLACTGIASCASSKGVLYFPTSKTYNTDWFTPCYISSGLVMLAGMFILWAIHPPLAIAKAEQQGSDTDAVL